MINCFLKGLKTSIDSKDYKQCTECLLKLKNLIPSTTATTTDPSPLNDNLLIYVELKEDFVVQQERLCYQLDQEWNDLIEISPDNDGSFIKISTSNNQHHLNQLTQLSQFRMAKKVTSTNLVAENFIFISNLKNLAKNFLKFCLNNILNESDDDQLSYWTDENGFKCLKVTTNLTSNSNNWDPRILDHKLNHLVEVISFLNENFLHFKVQIHDDPNKKETTTLMALFSQLIIKDFIKMIYDNLIIKIIPLNHYNSQIEQILLANINKFERSLIDLKLIDTNKDESVFSEYLLSNVEELYVRKKCQHVMEKGRSIMKNKDLFYRTIRLPISPSFKGDNLLTQLQQLEETNNLDKSSELDNLSLLQMPQCAISEMVKLIVDLVDETLTEASLMITKTTKTSDNKNVILLCLVARNLFDLYQSVVPTCHQDNLKNVPILSAIAYNDFLYLSYTSIRLCHEFKHIFNIVKQQTNNFSFINFVVPFFTFGSVILNDQIGKQEQILLQYLNEESNGVCFLSEKDNYSLLKKSFNQCAIQMNSLSSIWMETLPRQVYHRVFGQFFHLICKNLIKACLRIEDISSEDATYLHDALLIIKKSTLDVFNKSVVITNNDISYDDDNSTTSTSPSQSPSPSMSPEKRRIEDNLGDDTLRMNLADLNATKYIKSWERFKYLLVLLKINLQEIVDQWSDGKGPMAQCFDSEEIRHFIRALFMITDKRSAALAKIK
jgi:hypothetical protein